MPFLNTFESLVIFALLAERWLRRSTLGVLVGAMTLCAGARWKIVPELFLSARSGKPVFEGVEEK